GRSVAWTSDLRGKWAVDWVRWDKFAQFAAQLVGWTLPRVSNQTVSVESALVGGEVEVNVGAQDAGGTPLTGLTVQATIVGSQAQSHPLDLKEVAPGRYVGRIASPEAGSYLIQTGGLDSSGKAVFAQTAGLIVPYSPEYRQGQSNLPLLRQIATATGGTELGQPELAFA